MTYDADREGWAVGDEDLFQANHPDLRLLVDVGWYPAENPDGRFRVELVPDGEWEAATVLAESEDIEVVLAALRSLPS